MLMNPFDLVSDDSDDSADYGFFRRPTMRGQLELLVVSAQLVK